MNTNEHESDTTRRRASVSLRGSPWLKTAGLLAVIAIGASILLPPLQAKRTERRVRAMLLSVQEALQRYHVKEELYPKRMMNGHELIKLLVEGKHLDAGLANPWTGAPYAGSSDEDWLRYRTDGLAETYELTVLVPGSERVEFRLDSTKHQSLE
jgi:hypothetical protein